MDRAILVQETQEQGVYQQNYNLNTLLLPSFLSLFIGLWGELAHEQKTANRMNDIKTNKQL